MWASDHHDVCLTDDSSKTLAAFRIGHDSEGFERLHRVIAEHQPERAIDADMEHRSAVGMRLEMLQRPAIERAPFAQIELRVERMELPHSRFMQVGAGCAG